MRTGPIAIVLPRKMQFSPRNATSIDLCVHDFVLHSAYKQQTIVVAEECEQPFDDINLESFPKSGAMHRMRNISRILNRIQPKVIVVHQHLLTASKLAKVFSHIPVVLHRHNFTPKAKNWLSQKIVARRMRKLAAFVVVSEACKQQLRQDWPGLQCPVHVVHNGLDLSGWFPKAEREKTIVCVSNGHPNKGTLEVVEAMLQVLPDYPEWRGKIICPEVKGHEDYYTRLSEGAARSSQLELINGLPFAQIKSLCEEASINIVASHMESFGRVAIEAFSGGSALISTRSGGLDEVIGDAAVSFDSGDSQQLAESLGRLMDDSELRRCYALRGQKRVKALFDINAASKQLDRVYTCISG